MVGKPSVRAQDVCALAETFATLAHASVPRYTLTVFLRTLPDFVCPFGRIPNQCLTTTLQSHSMAKKNADERLSVIMTATPSQS